MRAPTDLRRALRLTALSILSFVCFAGCATRAVWEGTWDTFHEPWTPSRLAIYEAPARKDFLVAYDDLGPHKDLPVRRAYYLNENASAIRGLRKPHFVEFEREPKGAAVPLVTATNSPSASVPYSFYAVVEDNQKFTLYESNSVLGHYDLPTYRTSSGAVTRIAVTPFAVALDAGVAAGLLYLYALCYSHGHPPWP